MKPLRAEANQEPLPSQRGPRAAARAFMKLIPRLYLALSVSGVRDVMSKTPLSTMLHWICGWRCSVPTAPAYSGRGRPPKPRYRDDPTNLTQLALAAGRSALQHLTWRHGSRKNPDNPTAAMRSHFLAMRVRPANHEIPRNADGSLPECWLIVEWPPGKSEPTDYWLSDLPLDTPLQQLVRLAKIRWRIEHDYRELKDGLGLDHFEGRSYTGWHRHVTLTALAQAFCTLLRSDPKAPAPA